MAIVQISKIQHRTGANSELPQLDVGELGFASDERRMYIGNDPILHPPANSQTTTQTEILTEFSDLNFGKIKGTANGSINLANIHPGQLIVSSKIANTTNQEWINAGGNGLQPGNTSAYANANIHLGAVDYVKIGGGTNGYILQTDGTGNLTWAAFLSGNIVSGTPGGANSQIQFNDGGTTFGGDSGLTFNKVSKELTNAGNISANNINGALFGPHNGTVGATTPNTGAFTSLTVLSNANVTNTGTFGNVNVSSRLNVTGNANVGNLYSTGLANVGNLRVQNRVQSSLIPSVDEAFDLGSVSTKWRDLYLSGNTITIGTQTLRSNANGIISSNNLYVSANIVADRLTSTTISGALTTSAQPNITSVGTLSNLTLAGVVNLGNIANIRIGGGISGYVLTSNGATGVTWQPMTGGSGSGAAGGSNTQIQFNNNSNFGGAPDFTYDVGTSLVTTPNVAVNGQLSVANINKLAIPGGTNGQFLRTNGSGGLSWATAPGAVLQPAGANTQIQFNDEGVFNGTIYLTYFKTTQTLQVPFVNSVLDAQASSQPNVTSVGNLVSLVVVGNANVGNVITNISTANLFVGSGANLSNINGANVSQVANANYATYSGNGNHSNTANTVSTAAQPNITSVGNLTGLTVVGTTTLGAVSNVRITGGADGQVLSTNGNGTLSWLSPGVPNGIAGAVQFNSSNLFSGSTAFVFDAASNTLSVPNTTTTLTANSNAQPNITSVGTLANLAVTGNITSGNAALGNAVTANFFIGSGANLSNIQSGNITGTVANANYSLYANVIAGNSQPNITSVGNLLTLDVTGNANLGNITSVNVVTANYLYGDASNISNVPAANLVGNVPNANFASFAGYVTVSSQPNITTVGSLRTLTVNSSPLTSDTDAFKVIGDVGNMYVSPYIETTGGNVSGYSITTRASVSGAGVAAFNVSALSGVGLLAPSISTPTDSDIIVVAKNDSTAPNAHAILPFTSFTTNLGDESDSLLGEQYYRKLYIGDVTIRDTSDVPNITTSSSWTLMAGVDGLYLQNPGGDIYKINTTLVALAGDPLPPGTPTPLTRDPS